MRQRTRDRDDVDVDDDMPLIPPRRESLGNSACPSHELDAYSSGEDRAEDSIRGSSSSSGRSSPVQWLSDYEDEDDDDCNGDDNDDGGNLRDRRRRAHVRVRRGSEGYEVRRDRTWGRELPIEGACPTTWSTEGPRYSGEPTDDVSYRA